MLRKVRLLQTTRVGLHRGRSTFRKKRKGNAAETVSDKGCGIKFLGAGENTNERPVRHLGLKLGIGWQSLEGAQTTRMTSRAGGGDKCREKERKHLGLKGKDLDSMSLAGGKSGGHCGYSVGENISASTFRCD